MELRKCKIAEMIDFFTKPLFKNAQNQSHKGGSLEARKPLNKMNVSPPLNKMSGFLGLKFWWLNSFFSIPFLLESILRKIIQLMTPWAKYFI